MNRTPFRILTPTRILALAFIAVTVVGLTFLRFDSEDEPVSIPIGAKAGEMNLDACDYPTEDGLRSADCGTLIVSETRTDPQSQLIALPVIRIKARSRDPEEPIFWLTGGPGQSNLDVPQASRYSDNHDFILLGYRGVDGSVRLDCPEVESALQHSSDFLGEESLRAYSDAYRSCADRLTGEGIDLTSYGLVQQVEDLETARVALGYDRINLLSESAGTRTAMIYSWRYPESIKRSVMFGVNPPGNLLWSEVATDEQIRRYAVLCAEDPGCRARTDDLDEVMNETTLTNRWLFLPIKTGNVRVMSFMMMIQSTAEAGLGSAPAVFDAWLSADEGDASGLWLQSVLADVMYPKIFVWGQYAAGASIDAEAARDYFSSGQMAEASNLGRAATTFAWGRGKMVDGWPSAREDAEYTSVPTSDVETLLIGGELDMATPPQIATTQLLPYLPNGHEVVLPGFGHSPSFWSDQPEAGTRLITTFFDTGRVDYSLYEPQSVDFSPGMRGTTLAKSIAAALIGFALVAVLSLLWMAHRTHTKGRFGPIASSVLRSVYPIILGLGGWAFGALIVLVTMPRVHLDNPKLVLIAVAVPIGLGIYWAWVDRDWSPTTKIWGIVAATGGALLGSWWGFTAIEPPLAIITAIAGATIGANLPLIVGDMVRNQRSAQTRHPVPAPRPPAVQKTS